MRAGPAQHGLHVLGLPSSHDGHRLAGSGVQGTVLPLMDGEEIQVAGVSLQVLHTPGHTSDSVCLRLPHDLPEAVLTGDTVLGRGTTMIDHPDGSLADYLASLERLSRRDRVAARTRCVTGFSVELSRTSPMTVRSAPGTVGLGEHGSPGCRAERGRSPDRRT